VTWCKRRSFTGLTVKQIRWKKGIKENVARGTSKTWKFGKRRRVKPEGITGIRRTLRWARVAQHNVHVIRKNQTRNKGARRTPKRLTFGKKSQAKPECKSRFKDRGARWLLHLKNEKRAN
jgi:hypothetical protein